MSTNDSSQSLAPPANYEHRRLDHDAQEHRFLVLLPCSGEKSAVPNEVRCRVEYRSLDEAKDFVAVKNSRGYRLLNTGIYVDDKVKQVPVAVETFLRYFRRDSEPVKLWIRHICLDEFNGDEKHYFNRHFIDSMYAQSSQVVDMSAYNQSLLDSRVTTPGFQMGCMTPKEWDPSQGTYELPKIYPMKIGQRVSETDPQDYYAYVPLDSIVQEIRVLVIQESEDSSAPIIGRFAHLPLYSHQGYYALSYAWGDATPTVDIVASGQKLTIRKNLETILRTLRRQKGFVAVWIDAICIDQANLAERERQLPRMADIYRRAVGVICHMGPEDDDTSEVLEFAQELYPLFPGPSFDPETQTWDIERNPKVGSDRFPRLCVGLYRLLTRQYLRRVWVLQEVANSSGPVVAIGNRVDISLHVLELALKNLYELMTNNDNLIKKMKELAPDLASHLSRHELRFARTMFYFRHMASKGQSNGGLLASSTMGDFLSIKDDSPRFLESLLLARDSGATVEHDKVFGLWSLARDKDGLEFSPNYSKTPQQTFTDFTKAWAMQHNSLDIIAAAEPSSTFFGRVPSWVPDWTIPSKASCLARRDRVEMGLTMIVKSLDGVPYSADGGREDSSTPANNNKPLFSFNNDDTRLRAKGMMMDHIAGYYTYNGDGNEDENAEDNNAAKILACAADMYDSNSMPPGGCPYPDPKQAAIAMVHGDSTSTWTPILEDPSSSSSSSPESNKNPYLHYKPVEASQTKHLSYFAGKDGYHPRQAAEVRAAITRGRVLAVTARRKWMCLVPRSVAGSREMVFVAVLAGCSVPVLVVHRPEEEEGQGKDGKVGDGEEVTFHGQFFGTAFVQGLMDGEEVATAGDDGGLLGRVREGEGEGDGTKGTEKKKIINFVLR